MTAILTGASTFLDLGAGGTSTPSGSITVPAGTTLLVVCPVMTLNRTTSTMTFNGVSMTKNAASSSGANPSNYHAETWTLANPAIGAHTLAGTLSGVARGAWMVFFVKGNTGIGAGGGNVTAVVALSPAPADSSLVLFAGGIEAGSAIDSVGNGFQNNGIVHASTGLSTFCSTQRGYPQAPSQLMKQPTSSVATATEILS